MLYHHSITAILCHKKDVGAYAWPKASPCRCKKEFVFSGEEMPSSMFEYIDNNKVGGNFFWQIVGGKLSSFVLT